MATLIYGTVICAFALGAPAKPEKLAVLDLEAKGVERTLADNVGALITAGVRKNKRFDVISRQDIEKMLKFEESKELSGQSANSDAIASMSETLGIAKMLHGSLGKIGSQYVITLSLIDTHTVEVLAAETVTVKAEQDALVSAAGQITDALFKELEKREAKNR